MRVAAVGICSHDGAISGDESVTCKAPQNQFGNLPLGNLLPSIETIADYSDSLSLTLLSDPDFATSRRFRSFDDFEEIELHSTFLIDHEGHIHWSNIGGDPYMDFDFLKAEIERLNGRKKSVSLSRR